MKNSLSEVHDNSKAPIRVWEREVGKRGKKKWKNRGRETNGLLWGQPPQGACVCVCVLGGHSGEGWGHEGRDQSFGASSAGNRDDGERMEGVYGGRE